jgi:hypothetical protein
MVLHGRGDEKLSEWKKVIRGTLLAQVGQPSPWPTLSPTTTSKALDQAFGRSS